MENLRYGNRQYPGNARLIYIGPLCFPRNIAKWKRQLAETIVEMVPELTGICFCGGEIRIEIEGSAENNHILAKRLVC